MGAGFDSGLWGVPERVSGDPAIAAVVDLARRELRAGNFAAATGIALCASETHTRRARGTADTLAGAPFSLDIGTRLGSDYHAAMGDAWRLLGEADQAAELYRRAIELSTGSRAHVGLASLRLAW